MRAINSINNITTALANRLQLARKDAASAFWPESENDYIRIRRLMIAKSLFAAALLALNVFFVVILFIALSSLPKMSSDGIPAYKYSSVMLRRFTGVATILDKNKKPVYEGNLVKGKATGYGELKDGEGKPIYAGEFADNRYNGEGELYYGNGAVKYRGQFKNNLFDGNGTLYHESGEKSYEGGFILGKKQGEGALFDSFGKEIYKGVFLDNGIFFEGYIGGEGASLGDFGGARAVYSGEYDVSVSLREFGVMYVLEQQDDGSASVVRMYDITGAASKAQEPCSAPKLRETLGVPFYAGYADVLTPDAAAAEELRLLGGLPRDSGLNYEIEPVAGGIFEVVYEPGQTLYLESYSDGDWFYTYYFLQGSRSYLFYSTERAKE